MTMGTRIVVMKDGVIQQVDTPQALYERPANLFVAGFIGSPPMNFINATVEKRGQEIHLLFGKEDIKLPEGKAKKLEGTDYIGKEVVMGIRPEDIHDEPAYIEQMPDNAVEATVSVVEMLGAETLLYLTINDTDFTARVNPRTKARTNDVIKVVFDANKIHLFDKETERVIMN